MVSMHTETCRDAPTSGTDLIASIMSAQRVHADRNYRECGVSVPARQPAESPSACSRTLSMHIAESVVSASQPCIICARSLACMLCTCTQKPHSSLWVSRAVRILSLLQIAVWCTRPSWRPTPLTERAARNQNILF